MQPPLHSSFWQERSHSGWLYGAYNWIVVTKPNAINFCKNPKPDTSEHAFHHLPAGRFPLLPASLCTQLAECNTERNRKLMNRRHCYTIKDGLQGPKGQNRRHDSMSYDAWEASEGEAACETKNYRGPVRRPWKASSSRWKTVLTFSHSDGHCLTLAAPIPGPPRSPSQWSPQTIHSPWAALSSFLLWPHLPTSLPSPSLALVPEACQPQARVQDSCRLQPTSTQPSQLSNRCCQQTTATHPKAPNAAR